MKFYYVYVLRSLNHDFTYIGFSKDLRKRLQHHDAGFVQSTKAYRPYNLIFYEAYCVMSDAKRREMYLKTNKGKQALMTMLKDYFSTLSSERLCSGH
jgi:putative endonuclease